MTSSIDNTPAKKSNITSPIDIPEIIAKIAPDLVANWPSMITTQQVEQLLIKAINTWQVSDVGRAILLLDMQRVSPEGRLLAQMAVATCETIINHNVSEQQRIESLLNDAGVPVLTGSDQTKSVDTQIHRFELSVEAKNVPKALATIKDAGYLSGDLWQKGALQSVLRSRSNITLLKTDEVTTRLNLCWPGGGAKSRWRRVFQPDDVDYHLIDLPSALWFLYAIVKPFRLVATRIFGWQHTGDLAPFLGTPTDLVPALLELAAVTADDVLIDLGCGDGRILVEAARLRGCRAVGVEQDKGLVDLARAKIKKETLDHLVQVIHGDIRNIDLADFSVLFLFLPVSTVAHLLPSLQKHLVPSARIIIHEQIPIDPNLKPDRSIPLFSPSALTVAHLWQVV